MKKRLWNKLSWKYSQNPWKILVRLLPPVSPGKPLPKAKQLSAPQLTPQFWTMTRQIKRIQYSRHKSTSQESFLKLNYIFITKKSRSALNEISPISVAGTSTPYFKIVILLFFFKKYLNPQVRINKISYVHCVNYHPCLSGMTPRGYIL